MILYAGFIDVNKGKYKVNMYEATMLLDGTVGVPFPLFTSRSTSTPRVTIGQQNRLLEIGDEIYVYYTSDASTAQQLMDDFRNDLKNKLTKRLETINNSNVIWCEVGGKHVITSF